MIQVKVFVQKTIGISNQIKFIAPKENFEVIDNKTKESYSLNFYDIFPNEGISKLLIRKYFTFTKILYKFNNKEIKINNCDYEFDNDNWFVTDFDEMKLLLDYFGQFLFKDIVKEVKELELNDFYKDIEIEYVGLTINNSYTSVKKYD
jgi:hypothetical protein